MNDAEEIDSHSPEEDSVLGDPEEDNDSDQDNHMELNLDLIGKDETQWQSLSISHVQRRLLQQWNIVNFTPGPTSFASRRIIESSPFSSFRVFVCEAMLRTLRTFTVAEAHLVSGGTNCDVTLDEHTL